MLRRKASVISSDYSSDNSSPRGNSSSPVLGLSRSEKWVEENVGDVVNRIRRTNGKGVPQSFVEKDIKAPR